MSIVVNFSICSGIIILLMFYTSCTHGVYSLYLQLILAYKLLFAQYNKAQSAKPLACHKTQVNRICPCIVQPNCIYSYIALNCEYEISD